MVHTGLSRSAIYDRMDKKSPRYADDFPKSFSLSGGAIGWFKNEVDAWLEACATQAKSGTPFRKTKAPLKAQNPSAQAISAAVDKTASPKPPQNSSLQSTSTAKRPTLQLPLAPRTKPGNLAEAIVKGSTINARLVYFLKMQAWTPAMGALLISGIDAPLNCFEIPTEGIGLDEEHLNGQHQRFSEAKRIHNAWCYWDEDDPHTEIEPHFFLEWCLDERINSEWLQLFLDLLGYKNKNAVDLTASRFAMLTTK